MGDDVKETQDSEVLALKAIYEGQVEDLRKNDPWKVWRPPELRIRLQPSKGLSGATEVNCELSLHVKMVETYPKQCPEIAVRDAKGLSEKDQAFLKNKLLKAAAEHKNEVMLMDLCQLVEEYLHDKNQRISKLSFHEEMLKTKEAKKRQESTDEQKLLEEEAAEIEAEMERRKIEAKDARAHGKQVSETEPISTSEEAEELEIGRLRSASLPPKSPKKLQNIAKNKSNSPTVEKTEGITHN